MAVKLNKPGHNDILRILDGLRRRIRFYVGIEGMALMLIVAGLLFWLSLGVDAAYFHFNKFELPVWFRQGFVVAAMILIGLSFATWVGMRLFRAYRRRALALVLERQFSELDDRLITAVDYRNEPEVAKTPLAESMLDRTTVDAAQTVRGLRLSKVFDAGPLRRAVAGAIVLGASIGWFFYTNQAAAAKWVAAYIKMEDVYWERTTHLKVKVVTGPGDTIRDFQHAEGSGLTDGEPGEYRHPRGEDLTLLIMVPYLEMPESSTEEKLMSDGQKSTETANKKTQWKIPDKVAIQFELDNNRGEDEIPCLRLSEKEAKLYASEDAAACYRVILPRVLDSMTIHVVGGDFRNRKPYRIEVVEPPRLDRMILFSQYPDYLGWNEPPEEWDSADGPYLAPVQVLGTQADVPMETGFKMHARTNKPLLRARIAFDGFEMRLGRLDERGLPANNDETIRAFWATVGDDGQILNRDGENGDQWTQVAPEVASQFFDPDHKGFNIPFVMSTQNNEKTQQRVADMDFGLGQPFVIPPDAEMRIYLEDEDHIVSPQAEKVVFLGVVDQPPVVDTSLKGISLQVTAKARIPFVGMLSDDYGVAAGRYEYVIGRKKAEVTEEDWVPKDLQKQLEEGFRPREYPLMLPDEVTKYVNEAGEVVEKRKKRDYDLFQVSHLDLKPGQILVVSMVAEDADNLNGPNTTRGDAYEFKIVTKEELIAILYYKELNLRKRFQSIIDEVVVTRKKVQEQDAACDRIAVLKEKDQLTDEEAKTLDELQVTLQATAERSQHQISKNANETYGIEVGFEDVLFEHVNNAIANRNYEERLEKIVENLALARKFEFPNVDRALRNYEDIVRKGGNPKAQIAESSRELGELLERLESAKKLMEEVMAFHRTIVFFQALLKDQIDLNKMTVQEREDYLFKKLGGDIFPTPDGE